MIKHKGYEIFVVETKGFFYPTVFNAVDEVIHDENIGWTNRELAVQSGVEFVDRLVSHVELFNNLSGGEQSPSL